MPLPVKDVTLNEKIKLTSLLLKSSASIVEINAVRKHLSQIKGGNFACLAYPATLVTLCISDVVNDPVDVIASGPAVPDTSTYKDAVRVLKKYVIWNKVSKSIRKHLSGGVKGEIKETPKKKEDAFCKGNIYNVMIANHKTIVDSAARLGKKLKYNVFEAGSNIEGDARKAAKIFIKIGSKKKRLPALIVGAGETTMKVLGRGQGGRNQELVLYGLKFLRDNMTLCSFATDGIDGRSPAAGAIADISTKRKDIDKYLGNSNTYGFFKKTGDYILTGPTGTNIGDLIMLVVVKIVED